MTSKTLFSTGHKSKNMIEMNQDNIQELRDKVADIKYDTQQVLDRIDSMDAAYQEQTGREQTLEAKVAQLKAEVDKARLDKVCAPTMPVIPKAVAIAIFREGMAYGASRVCDELENASDICIEESEYYGHFEVSFTKEIDLSDELDLDYLRESTSVYDESSVIDALGTLCADKEFACRIHGIDDQAE